MSLSTYLYYDFMLTVFIFHFNWDTLFTITTDIV